MSGWYPTVMYGGAPDPWQPDPVRPAPSLPLPAALDRIVIAGTRKATIAARVDADGVLHLRLSIDGESMVEIEGDARGVTATVDV